MKKSYIVLLISLFASYSFGLNALNAAQKKDSKKVAVSKKSKQVNKNKQVNSKKVVNNGDNKVKNNNSVVKQKNVVKVEQVNNNKQQNLISSKSVVGKDLNVKKKQSRFYGKASVGVGYEYQRYTGGDVKGRIDSVERKADFGFSKSRSNQAPVISLGYNMYYKLGNRFALLGGLEAQGRYPVSGKEFVSGGKIEMMGGAEFVDQVSGKFEEYLRLNAKLGFKADITKKLSFETYGFVGSNMAKVKLSRKMSTNQGLAERYSQSKMKFGLTAGAGFDVVVADRFTIGAEYRRGYNNYNLMSDKGPYKFKMRTYSILAKVGYRF